eukprot:10296517-Ditylum_brightwellii.AAC.1
MKYVTESEDPLTQMVKHTKALITTHLTKFLHHPTGTTKLTNDHHMSELKQKKLHGVFFVQQKEIPQ